MHFLDRVNEEPPRVSAHGLAFIRAAGWTDEQI